MIFLTDRFKDDHLNILAIFLRVTFTYFSIQTYLHLGRCFLSDPGYVPDWLKAPLKMPEKLAPLELVRLYNMRAFESNNIYSFDNLDSRRNNGDVGGDENTSLSTTNTEEGEKLIR